MLSSESKQPLIIDQPEDNLDSEFIIHTFVPVLRRAKERRQVIIVTHNANIAVLGDAEQIMVMKTNRDRSQIVARGSIDHPGTRDAACSILEGSREAFSSRKDIRDACLLALGSRVTLSKSRFLSLTTSFPRLISDFHS